MSIKDWIFAGVEAIFWYGFLYYFLFSIKNDVNLFQSALVLLLFCYVAIIFCPWVRHTSAWKELFNKK